ncbi:hypothetical protein MHBO_001443 [Bonamia ostreae]|uniref:Glycosyltransferase n=1 Tax=Bonamia ostreae TaxID=126728 RepID=A0ABV2AJ19_9EUKA
MLGMECILHAKLMGLTVLLTSHSLYSPGALSVICSSYLYNSIYTHLDHIICVSKTCKENFVVNSIFDHTKISVIPNGIDSTRFKPDPSKRPNPKKKINVICIGRFYKRKGIELITGVIPLICAKYKNAHFIIVGDGPKKILVEEMRKKNQLNDRITIKPGIPFDKVRENLIEAHIFLNGSLTESFCMANLEAMSCGLHVVTTNVGGIPEVNPDDQFTMCSPNISSMESALSGVIDNFSVDEEKLHRIVGNRFNWQNVAERTLKTYVCAKSSTTAPFLERIKKIKELGVSSYFFILILIVEIMLLNFLEWVDPEEGFEIAIDYPQNK